MVSEAQVKANEKYRKKAIKTTLLRFFPKDYELFEKVTQKGKEAGSVNEYIKDILRKELEK